MTAMIAIMLTNIAVRIQGLIGGVAEPRSQFWRNFGWAVTPGPASRSPPSPGFTLVNFWPSMPLLWCWNSAF
jgi:hypothetical protein